VAVFVGGHGGIFGLCEKKPGFMRFFAAGGWWDWCRLQTVTLNKAIFLI